MPCCGKEAVRRLQRTVSACALQAGVLLKQDLALAAILDADSQDMLAMLSRPAQPMQQQPPAKRSRLNGALASHPSSQAAVLPRMARF